VAGRYCAASSTSKGGHLFERGCLRSAPNRTTALADYARQAIDKLPDRQLEVVTLRDVDGTVKQGGVTDALHQRSRPAGVAPSGSITGSVLVQMVLKR
jgi:hypothetical protein